MAGRDDHTCEGAEGQGEEETVAYNTEHYYRSVQDDCYVYM